MNQDPQVTQPLPPEVRRRRRAFFKEARFLTPYLAARMGDELLFVKTADNGVSRTIFVRGYRVDAKVLKRTMARLADYGVELPLEAVFVDVGANIGSTTVLALCRYGFVRGVALEPEPENFRLLRLNLVANELDARVQALPVAASALEGEVLLRVARRKSGIHRLVAEADAERRTVSVEAVTLDGLVGRGVIDPVRVGLLWVDVVGHEEAVLEGASQLLDAGVPLVTAIRPSADLGKPWQKQRVLELLTSRYTDVAELRDLQTGHPIGELTRLLAALRKPTDILFVRR